VVINTSKDMHKYYKSAKKHSMLVVIVKADWCGHCHNYLANIWKKLEAIQRKLPSKKVGLVQMDEKALPSSPLKSSKINGYPSLLLIGKDGKPAEFKDEETGEATNAMPNANSLPMMESIVSGDAPEAVEASGPAAAPVAAAISAANEAESESDSESENEEVSAEASNEVASNAVIPEAEDSPPLTVESEENKDNSSAILLDSLSPPVASGANSSEEGEDAGVTVSSPPTLASDTAPISDSGNASTTLPPTAEDDLLDTYSGPASSGAQNSSQLGGSLYAALLEAAKGAAPAAGLLAAGTLLSRRQRRRGKGKRSTKKLRR
jgi:thiol-disulfide isomerase/thioredoxin